MTVPGVVYLSIVFPTTYSASYFPLDITEMLSANYKAYVKMLSSFISLSVSYIIPLTFASNVSIMLIVTKCSPRLIVVQSTVAIHQLPLFFLCIGYCISYTVTYTKEEQGYNIFLRAGFQKGNNS